jgi:hypothetical protein
MKKVLLGVLCLAVSTSVFAQKTAGRTYAEPTVVDVHLDANALFRQATGPRAQVSSEGPDNAFLFAVVGSAPGAGGTFFKSEVTLVNNDTTFSQNLGVLYFPSNGGSCNGALTKTLRLNPNSFVVYSDFVSQVFGATGLGSVVVLGVDGSGNFDSRANIDGFSRIWTPVAGFQGTASQSFPAVAISGYPGVQYIYGLHTDSGFRSNVFVFNYLPTFGAARTFGLNFVGSNGATGGATLTVQPCSLGVYSIAGNYASTSLSVVPPDSGGGWFAFGSTVDNLSGDNWSVAARPDGIH